MTTVYLKEIDLDGIEIRPGVVAIGKATFVDGMWRVLATAFGALVVAEVTVMGLSRRQHD